MLNNNLFSTVLFLSACVLTPLAGISATHYEFAADSIPIPQCTVAVIAVPIEKPVEYPTMTDKTANLPGITLEMTSVKAARISHVLLDSLLQQYVSISGQVNYKGLKADKKALDTYCQLLSDNPVQDNWSREEQMAYWINAYNAFTLKLIVDNYPTKSILNFDGGKTWDVRRIKIGDKKYSLNNIENDILRPQFKDARIHFAVNCAAKSCPPLWNRAYTAENLEPSLDLRAKAFVNNPDFNSISADKASVSKIFDWYGADFGDLKKYLNRYAKVQLKNSATVTFKEYDWELNQ
jgi:Protein of unknown function, DUF547